MQIFVYSIFINVFIRQVWIFLMFCVLQYFFRLQSVWSLKQKVSIFVMLKSIFSLIQKSDIFINDSLVFSTLTRKNRFILKEKSMTFLWKYYSYQTDLCNLFISANRVIIFQTQKGSELDVSYPTFLWKIFVEISFFFLPLTLFLTVLFLTENSNENWHMQQLDSMVNGRNLSLASSAAPHNISFFGVSGGWHLFN